MLYDAIKSYYQAVKEHSESKKNARRRQIPEEQRTRARKEFLADKKKLVRLINQALQSPIKEILVDIARESSDGRVILSRYSGASMLQYGLVLRRGKLVYFSRVPLIPAKDGVSYEGEIFYTPKEFSFRMPGFLNSQQFKKGLEEAIDCETTNLSCEANEIDRQAAIRREKF